MFFLFNPEICFALFSETESPLIRKTAEQQPLSLSGDCAMAHGVGVYRAQKGTLGMK